MRPGRTRISLSRCFMMSHRLPAKTDGARCVDFSEVSACGDGMTILVASQNLNTINHMRRTEGGAFPLPSTVAGSQGPTSKPTDSRYSRRFATKCNSSHRASRRLVADSLRKSRRDLAVDLRSPHCLRAKRTFAIAIVIRRAETPVGWLGEER